MLEDYFKIGASTLFGFVAGEMLHIGINGREAIAAGAPIIECIREAGRNGEILYYAIPCAALGCVFGLWRMHKGPWKYHFPRDDEE